MLASYSPVTYQPVCAHSTQKLWCTFHSPFHSVQQWTNTFAVFAQQGILIIDQLPAVYDSDSE